MTNTQTATPDCQALVVDAEPTGLTLTAHLLAGGIRTSVTDRRPTGAQPPGTRRSCPHRSSSSNQTHAHINKGELDA